MITLEKLLTELKAESLNEIVAGCGGYKRKKSRGSKCGGRGRSNSSSSSSSGKSYGGGGCYTPPKPPTCGCTPGNQGCQ